MHAHLGLKLQLSTRLLMIGIKESHSVSQFDFFSPVDDLGEPLK